MRTDTSSKSTAKPKDDILWPFVYWPLIWILGTHVAVRIPWFFGVLTGK